jgi:hypothetical protein
MAYIQSMDAALLDYKRDVTRAMDLRCIIQYTVKNMSRKFYSAS